MEDDLLMLVALGPVQQFIASGRRLQDLYVASRCLSALAAAGIAAAGIPVADSSARGDSLPAHSAARQSPENMPRLLFPAMRADGSLPESVPHRFAFVSNMREEPATLAEDIKRGILDHWHKHFAQPVHTWLKNFPDLASGWVEIFQRQAESWLEFYWVAVPYVAGQHGAALNLANQAMAQRKLARPYPPTSEPGVKCTLTGTQSALFPSAEHWNPVRHYLQQRDMTFVLREQENLGTLATIKRFIHVVARDQPALMPTGTRLAWRQQSFPSALSLARGQPGISLEGDERDRQASEPPRYLAVLHLDGDNMGTMLGKVANIQAHQHFSRAISDFAGSVSAIVEQHYQGRLIYAGGDDVLALLPVWQALDCANELRNAFSAHLTQAGIQNATASAGISIAPYDYPLDLALESARQAEKQAKEDLGRNAVVVLENRGQVRPAGAKWTNDDTPDLDIARLIALICAWYANDPAAIERLSSLAHLHAITAYPAKGALLSPSFGYDVQQLALTMDTIHRRPSPSRDASPPDVAPAARVAALSALIRRRLHEDLPNKTQLATDLAALLAPVGERIGWEQLANWLIMARFLTRQGAVR